MAKMKSVVKKELCVSCGCCIKVCPKDAIEVKDGLYAHINQDLCIGCGKCVTECPASIIEGEYSKRDNKVRFKKWYDYLWIFSIAYFALGFFNIIFAWLGMICFILPLLFAIFKGNKAFCNLYCDRGQLLGLIGGRLGLSRKRSPPKWMYSKYFRYGFLIFFFAMFFVMLWNTYLVFTGTKSLSQAVTVLWTFNVPWSWAYHGNIIAPWVSQYAFGFYSVMLTSTILGLLTMLLFKPRSWCVYCPMGTMTQAICKVKSMRKNKFQ